MIKLWTLTEWVSNLTNLEGSTQLSWMFSIMTFFTLYTNNIFNLEHIFGYIKWNTHLQSKPQNLDFNYYILATNLAFNYSILAMNRALPGASRSKPLTSNGLIQSQIYLEGIIPFQRHALPMWSFIAIFPTLHIQKKEKYELIAGGIFEGYIYLPLLVLFLNTTIQILSLVCKNDHPAAREI